MSHERESERGGAFTRRNFLYGAASTAAVPVPLKSPAAGAGRFAPADYAVPGCVTVALRIRRSGLPAEHRLAAPRYWTRFPTTRPDGNEKGLRPWQMRSLQRPRVSDICGTFVDHDAFRCGYRACTDHVGALMCKRGPRRRRGPDSQVCERRCLPPRGQSDHRRCDRTGRGGQLRRH
jgi:hypothetical protein